LASRLYEIAFQLAGRISSSLPNAFRTTGDRMRQLNQRTNSVRAALRQLERDQRAGTITAEQYARQHERLTRQLRDAERSQQRFSRTIDLQNRANAFRDRARANMMDAAAMAVALGAPVAVAIKFESAMADVKKVVEFDAPQQFKEMEKDILALSKRIPMAAEGLAQIVASGGQAGLAREELTQFAEAAAKMGVAFDIAAEDAGQMMAEWRSAFKMNQEQVNTLADQINHLGNTTAAAAPKISDVVRRIGPLGDVGGAAAGQIAALGATMVGAGVAEDVAATGIKNMILSLVAGESATASQAAAFQALGMDAKKMAVAMQEDAQGAITSVFKALQQLSKERQASVLSELFGKESIGAIAPLLTNLDALEDNFRKVGDAAQYAGSMQAEFDSRSATTENSLQLLKNRVSALAITTGSILLPPLTDLAGKLSGLADRVTAFTEKHPNLTKAMVTGAAAALGLGVAVTGLSYAVSLAIAPFTSLAASLAASSAAGAAGAGVIGTLTSTFAALAGPAAIAAAGIGFVAYKLSRDAIPATDLFGDKVSESTQKAVSGFLSLNTEATNALNQLNWSGQAVTSEMATAIVNNFSAMNNQIVDGFKKQADESLAIMQQFFAESEALTEQNEAEILAKIQAGNQDKITTAQEAENKIRQILTSAANEKRTLTEQEKATINKLQQEMVETGIQALSKGELESKVIIERMKNQHSQITAQEAAEVVKNSLKIRDESIAAANETYDQRIAAIIRQRDEMGTITADEAEALIAEATRARDEQIAKAEEAHQGVVKAAKAQAKEYVDEINWMTGEVLSKWNFMINKIEGRVEKLRKWLRKHGVDVASPDEYSSSRGGITPHATGGILTRPHMGLVAEDGPEAIIPLSSKRRQRAMVLWQRAGQMLGVVPHAEGGIFGSSRTELDTGPLLWQQFRRMLNTSKGGGTGSGGGINVTFAPVIHGAGPEIMPALEQQQKSFMEQLQDVLHEQRRVAYD